MLDDYTYESITPAEAQPDHLYIQLLPKEDSPDCLGQTYRRYPE